MLWSVVGLHLILFPFTFRCGSRVHKQIGNGFSPGFLNEFHGWVSRSLNALKLDVYFLCKADLTAGVRASKIMSGWLHFHPPVLRYSV